MTGYPPCAFLVVVNWSLMTDTSPAETTPRLVPGAGTSAPAPWLILNAYTTVVLVELDAGAVFDAELADEVAKTSEQRGAREQGAKPSSVAMPSRAGLEHCFLLSQIFVWDLGRRATIGAFFTTAASPDYRPQPAEPQGLLLQALEG